VRSPEREAPKGLLLLCWSANLRVPFGIYSLLLQCAPYLRDVHRNAAVPVYLTRCTADYERLAVDHDGIWADANRLGCVQSWYPFLVYYHCIVAHFTFSNPSSMLVTR
jgi:hypothetical protein